MDRNYKEYLMTDSIRKVWQVGDVTGKVLEEAGFSDFSSVFVFYKTNEYNFDDAVSRTIQESIEKVRQYPGHTFSLSSGLEKKYVL